MTNLWPDEVGYVGLKAPLTILKEQASLLGEKTQGLVKARVEAVDKKSWSLRESDRTKLSSHSLGMAPADLLPQSALQSPLTASDTLITSTASPNHLVSQGRCANNTQDIQHKFIYDFYLIAPELPDFHYRLFTILYDINLYPVEFYLDDDIKEEIGLGRGSRTVYSEANFMDTLKKIFGSPKTRQIITALMLQSGGLDTST
jgi:hypothetical protein